MNRGFFGVLAARKGLAFAAAALPLYLGYYLYSSAAFAAGVVLHLAGRREVRQPRVCTAELPPRGHA